MKWSSVCAEQAQGVKPGDPTFTAWVRLAATPVRDVKAIVNPRGRDDDRRGGRGGTAAAGRRRRPRGRGGGRGRPARPPERRPRRGAATSSSTAATARSARACASSASSSSRTRSRARKSPRRLRRAPAQHQPAPPRPGGDAAGTPRYERERGQRRAPTRTCAERVRERLGEPRGRTPRRPRGSAPSDPAAPGMLAAISRCRTTASIAVPNEPPTVLEDVDRRRRPRHGRARERLVGRGHRRHHRHAQADAADEQRAGQQPVARVAASAA